MKRLTFGSLFVSLFIIILFSLCLINATASAGWQIEPVDTTGIVGRHSSLAFDAFDKPAIAYVVGGTSGDIKYAHFNGISWDITPVDPGDHSSLAFDLSGYPAISYYDWSNGDLRYAHFNGASWDKTTVDTTCGWWGSLAFDLTGNPAIAYYCQGDDDLKYAYFNGAGWDITPVDSEGDVGKGEDRKLAFDLSGNPAIAYYDVTNDKLKYASFNGTTWDKTIVDSVGTEKTHGLGSHCSLAFDSSGNPAISYVDKTTGDLKFAHFNGINWIVEPVDSAVGGWWNTLAFDTSDNPAISYYDTTNGDLKYAHFNGTNWITEPIDSTGDVGGFTSLAFDSLGNPAISYQDLTNGDLKYARFVPEDCDNEIDDDGDELIDCNDPECPPCTTTTTTTTTTSTTTTTTSTTTTTTTTSTTTTTFVCWCPADGFTACVSGQVTDSEGEPLAGKTVRFKGRLFPGGPGFDMKTRTDDNGCYKFTLPEGVGKIWVKRCRGGGIKEVSVPFGSKVNDVNFECKKRRR